MKSSVDDSGSIRLLLKGILGELGIKVLGVATSGREDIEAVRKARPARVEEFMKKLLRFYRGASGF